MERLAPSDHYAIPNDWSDEQAEVGGGLDRPRDYSEFSYDTITAEDVRYIVKDGLQRINGYYDSVVASNELAWDAIMAPLEDAVDQAGHVIGRALILGEVHPDQSVRDAVDAVQADFFREAGEAWYQPELYHKIMAYSRTGEAKRLRGEKARALEQTLSMFKILGYGLPLEQRARIKEIDEKLNENGAKFSQNRKNDKTVVTLTRDELEGMSEQFIDSLERTEDGQYVVTMESVEEEKRECNGQYVVTMKYPHVDPILMDAEKRETRRKVSEAFHALAVEANRPIVEESLQLRRELAQLLKYESFMHMTTEDHMVETPENLIKFYRELYEPLMERAAPEMEIMQTMLEIDGHEGPLMIYDRDYYVARLQEFKHKIDREKIREYLPADACIEGIHEICGEIFGFKVRQIEEKTWHEDVTVYELYDEETGERKAKFYLDLYSRPGKYTHAMTVPLRHGRRLPDGTYQEPIGLIVGNYSRPLFTIEDLVTQWHESGHLWQALLTTTELIDFSGMNTEHDISEAPSQMLENIMWEKWVLKRMTRHHKTGEPLDDASIDALAQSQQLYNLFEFLRRMHLSDIDMAIHDGSEEWDIPTINRNSSSISLFLQPEGTFLPGKFEHIMNGYEGGYHTYPYSKVKADDHYSMFEKPGADIHEVGRKYRRIFQERGGSKDSIENEKEFLGREPNNIAFLRRLGAKARRSGGINRHHYQPKDEASSSPRRLARPVTNRI